ncbi:hypothetical protein O181_018310 [Austropuccinia psidii MF-1]|uniref:Uncharacterized protein n=1 Tax=Austropuccinia psidii MF-1 TaxID=1389203 RepID=A0A9Q3C8J0_9BASI|nr:hypothetical protein [Austropuccinia psidii MF-1]
MFYLVSSIRESRSDYSISESSIEIQTSPASRGLITKKPFEGPVGHSGYKSKRQEFQPREEAQIEDARASTSFKSLSRIFDTLIESPEADITAITVVRPEPYPTGKNRDIPVSVQELVYGSKATGVGTSENFLDRHNELLSSSNEFHGPRKDRGSSEGFDTHFLQRTSPTDKSLVEKPKHFVRGPEKIVGPKEGKQSSGISLNSSFSFCSVLGVAMSKSIS